MKKTYVLDTNVILHSAQALNSFEDNEVVIPMTVIEELDKFKRNQDELGRNTRQAIRQIDALRQKGSLAEGVPLDNSPDPDKCGSLRVMISEGRLSDSSDMKVPDNRILNVAKMLMEQKKQPVIFITKDLNLRLKADALGIPVEDFECEQVNSDELYSGVLTLPADAAIMDRFHRDGFIEIPKDLTVYPNQFVIFADMANEHHTTVGWCRHGRIEVLPDGAGEHVGGITPRSLEQRMALILLTDPEIQVVSLVGQAGSGKTLLALAAAVEQAINNNLYERILVSRPIVPMGKDIGYMPGGKDEKLAVWMQPIYDNLEFLLQNGGKKDQQSVRRRLDDMRRNHQLELEALTYIRGRSIPNQFIIVDEAQNLTPHEVKTIISRAGEGSKIVLTGDPEQIDNPYLDAESNGLCYAVERLKGSPMHGHVILRKSERSDLAGLAASLL